MKVILMDIEGTTTAISFVHETLFPFSRERMESFVLGNLNNPAVSEQIEDVKKTVLSEEDRTISTDEAIATLIRWIDEDRKHGALKNLQGMIWKEGFESGALKGHFYGDVPEKLREWKESGLTLAIYSSGSVQAQKLLYQHSEYGDLTPLISAYFDTKMGQKRDVDSYLGIARELDVDPKDVLFLSDIYQELDAAREAGMKTLQLERQEIERGDHQVVSDFTQIKRA